MSEADVRNVPTRGRSSTRGGRAGFARGGPRGGRKVNGTSNDVKSIGDSLEEQGELGEMKKKYCSELEILRDMFPDWTDTDLVFALQEVDGDISATVDKITQGAVSQFAEVKKTKDRARSKVKDDSAGAGTSDKPGFSTRGGHGRGGFEHARGGRGRASDRGGRGGNRGSRGGHATTNGITKEGGGDSVLTTETSAWDTEATTATADGGWEASAADTATKETGNVGHSAWANIAAESAPAIASEGVKSSLISEGAPKKSWASMFAKPKPAPAPVPPKQILTNQHPPPALNPSGSTPETVPAVEETKGVEREPVSPVPTIREAEEPAATQPEEAPAEQPTTPESEELTLAPSKVPLTEANVEHLPDESHPPATQTVASIAGSLDPRNSTPIPSHQAAVNRPALGGYATSANRLAGTGGRSASFQRRVLEQQEAVVMPGHNAVDRATVQFGSMGLNGEAGLDVDDEREEPETRQAPQHSPPSQPRTSLPPVSRQAAPQEPSMEPSMPEAVPTPKQAPGLPPASIQNQQQVQNPLLTQSAHHEQQMSQAYQYSRYGQAGMQQDSVAHQPKQYDPFGHQAQQDQFNHYGNHAHQAQQQAQPGFGGLSSAPSDYSSYYTSDQPRHAYSQYYSSGFGPQENRQAAQAQGQQDVAIGQQRSTSGFAPGQNEPAYASHAVQQAQSRFSDVPGSGNSTPNPGMGTQQQQPLPGTQQAQQSMHQAQAHQQQGAYNPAFPYGHPYYNSPYQQAYQNQFGFSHQLGGYAGGYQGKQGGVYGAPQGYGMSSQSSYEQHASSPANASAINQSQQTSMRSASGMGSALGAIDDYGRSSAQGNSHQQNSVVGSMNDPFARTAPGFGSQGYNQQNMTAGPEDSLKPFNDPKGGPSPALGQPGRPGSAANSVAGASQTGLPPPQSQHSAFGGYPGFPGQGSQYAGLGGLGNHQQGQGGMGGQNAYGAGYGAFSQYGSYGSRGGWGSNYTGH